MSAGGGARPRMKTDDIRAAGEREMKARCGGLRPLFADERQMVECVFVPGEGLWHAAFRVKCPGAAKWWRLRLAVRDSTGDVEGVKEEQEVDRA
jgi:hypothetical protein